MRIRILMMVLITIILLVACGKKTTEAPEFRDHGFSLQKVGFEHLYWNQNTLYNSINHSVCDSNGVYLFAYQGQSYYHPVNIGHFIQKALSDYNVSGDLKYLDYAEKSAKAIIDRATRSNRHLYYPYQFDYPASNQLTYVAPWYSGMAQGVMLSCFSRLYHFTHDPKYKSLADSTLGTFTDYDNAISTVYVTKSDTLTLGEGYYWVDEYPNPQRRFVLNGAISGAFGLYDYWWVFGDENAKRLFSMQMTSTMDHFLLYRNPRNISYYCLKFKNPDAYYHGLHQVLLNQCYLYTGDARFQAMANILYADHH